MDWFWKIIGFDPSALEGLSPALQAIIDLMPVVLGIVVIIGVFSALGPLRSRGEDEEDEEEAKELTELDSEIALIRKLQGKRL